MKPKTISDWLKKNKVSEQELAKKTQVTKGYINHLKLGRRTPSAKVALKIHEITRLPIKNILNPPEAA